MKHFDETLVTDFLELITDKLKYIDPKELEIYMNEESGAIELSSDILPTLLHFELTKLESLTGINEEQLLSVVEPLFFDYMTVNEALSCLRKLYQVMK